MTDHPIGSAHGYGQTDSRTASIDTPFKPFRICLSDGTHYDIVHHDMAFVGLNTVEVGSNLNADGFAEYFARCSILHITKLEDLPESVAR